MGELKQERIKCSQAEESVKMQTRELDAVRDELKRHHTTTAAKLHEKYARVFSGRKFIENGNFDQNWSEIRENSTFFEKKILEESKIFQNSVEHSALTRITAKKFSEFLQLSINIINLLSSSIQTKGTLRPSCQTEPTTSPADCLKGRDQL